jgi:hypothetical protein
LEIQLQQATQEELRVGLFASEGLLPLLRLWKTAKYRHRRCCQCCARVAEDKKSRFDKLMFGWGIPAASQLHDILGESSGFVTQHILNLHRKRVIKQQSRIGLSSLVEAKITT